MNNNAHLLTTQEIVELLSGQPTLRCPLGHSVTKALKLSHVSILEASIVVRRDHDCHFAVLAADRYRFPLHGIQENRQHLLGFRRGHVSHDWVNLSIRKLNIFDCFQ